MNKDISIEQLDGSNAAHFYQSVLYRDQILTVEEEKRLLQKIEQNSALKGLKILLECTVDATLSNDYYGYHLKREEQHGVAFNYQNLVSNKTMSSNTLQYLMMFRLQKICHAFVACNKKPSDIILSQMPYKFLVQHPDYEHWVQSHKLFKEPCYMDILTLKKECRTITPSYLVKCNYTHGWTPERTDWLLAAIIHQNKNNNIIQALHTHCDHIGPWSETSLRNSLEALQAVTALRVLDAITIGKELGVPFKWADLLSEPKAIHEEGTLHF